MADIFDSISSNTEEFDFSEAEVSEKVVVTIYGRKGEGKTTLAFSHFFPGTKACLSFDRKSAIVKKYLYKDSPSIKVYDAVRYYDSQPELITETANKTINYVDRLLDHITADWIVIDGTDILSHIAEMKMRYLHGLKPTQGISNMNVWKERNFIIRGIHYKALERAKKGIIYTIYTEIRDVWKDGAYISEELPKWLDVVMWESDVCIRVWKEIDRSKKFHFYMRVDTSKIPTFPTGTTKDITNIFVEGKVNEKEEEDWW